MGKKVPSALVLGFLVCSVPLQGQVSTALNQPDSSGFPQWAHDLRRAEIIAFGTFPFTMFTATFVMDSWRTSQHNWDTRYAPWPFKTTGAIEMTNREHEIVITVAGIGSLALALTDFVIIQIKRHKVRQRALQMPEGTPIIIKRPLAGADEEPEGPAESGETLEPSETPEGASVPVVPVDR
jgi:hypothetical protein